MHWIAVVSNWNVLSIGWLKYQNNKNKNDIEIYRFYVALSSYGANPFHSLHQGRICKLEKVQKILIVV